MKVKKTAKQTVASTKTATPMKSRRAAARKDLFGPNHDLIVEVTNSQKLLRVREEEIEDLVKFVFNAENIRAARLSIALLNDEEVHRLNRQFLGHDYPTDVITFPLSEPGEPIVGEIVLSTEYAAQEAVEQGWSLRHEVTLYIVHGILHLCGYDDKSSRPRKIMHMRQMELLDAYMDGARGEEPKSKPVAKSSTKSAEKGRRSVRRSAKVN